ncbi:hypothetical protein VNO77_03183 [Canavalia gladiata]|uniref:Uncharacterized protein n=1 Tax=Canavalia gladiata TaxID=3824 RepID=A0AAN9MUA8_CANGL
MSVISRLASVHLLVFEWFLSYYEDMGLAAASQPELNGDAWQESTAFSYPLVLILEEYNASEISFAYYGAHVHIKQFCYSASSWLLIQRALMLRDPFSFSMWPLGKEAACDSQSQIYATLTFSPFFHSGHMAILIFGPRLL